MKKIIFLTLAGISAVACAMDGAQEGQINYFSRYTFGLSDSDIVKRYFDDSGPNTYVVTKKRLFYHMAVQAGKNQLFNPTQFSPLITDISKQEDTPHVQTNHAQLYYTMLQSIPWNGRIDKEMGFTYHPTLLNEKFATIGFSAACAKNTEGPTIVRVFANNEDDFDSEMDHREKIETEFKALLAQAQKPVFTMTSYEKQSLADSIKRHNYVRLVQEKGVKGLDYLEMARGNADLARDIQAIYQTHEFELANQKLKELCDKWGMEYEESDSDEEK